jgi:hypothetical protein
LKLAELEKVLKMTELEKVLKVTELENVLKIDWATKTVLKLTQLVKVS